MFENLKITVVFEKPASDDYFNRSRTIYCTLSQNIYSKELDREDYDNLLSVVVEQLDIFIKLNCVPGEYFASIPSIYAHNKRMIVYQYAGYDV